MKKLSLNISSEDKPTDPLEIFNKLTLRGAIENIWETQAEALKDWHSNHREVSDLVVQMNTGGGKTLVGLLMAQSLANEVDGRVIYVCANNQLIEQTQLRADEVGLMPASRYKGKWHRQIPYEKGETFCLANYQGVFNGRSVFQKEPIGALVFDDAHVAEATIRGCFTVSIGRDHEGFKRIIQILRKHFAGSSRSTHFEQVAAGDFTPVLYVPMFVTFQHAEEVRRILNEVDVAEDKKTKFAWSHIEGHLDHCCVLMTGAGIEITPLVVPLGTLPYFADDVRRIYLTATLPSQTAFARTFGVVDPLIIKPSGKSGDAQRLMVFTPGEDDDEQREEAKKLVTGRKSCVISPSHKKAEDWVPPAKIYDSESGQDEINRFRESEDPEMLGLVARYDGIDLPGKSCNILILDRLPAGESLIDRFIDEGMKVETIRLAQAATRVVQAIGRIFRSNTDHGVVILVGAQLQSWLRSRRHHRYLPARLQQQIELSSALVEQIDAGEAEWPDLINGILEADPNWDEMYKQYIDQIKPAEPETGTDWYIPMVPEERAAYERLWEGQPEQAADAFSRLSEKAISNDPRLAAWYRHWHGLSALSANDRARSIHEFIQAANIRAELGRPSEDVDTGLKVREATLAGAQATRMAAMYRSKKTRVQSILRQIEVNLKYGDETAKAEEALKEMGGLLGLSAERPDKKGTGPDVIWAGEGGPAAWGFELKTNKQEGGEYSKSDTSQCQDHHQWLLDNHGESAQIAIVGRLLTVSKLANPSEYLEVIDLDSFRDLFLRLTKVYESVEGGGKSDLELRFQTWLDHYGMLWPKCVEALNSRKAIDLRVDR